MLHAERVDGPLAFLDEPLETPREEVFDGSETGSLRNRLVSRDARDECS
jgi:hypothetical protein